MVIHSAGAHAALTSAHCDFSVRLQCADPAVRDHSVEALDAWAPISGRSGNRELHSGENRDLLLQPPSQREAGRKRADLLLHLGPALIPLGPPPTPTSPRAPRRGGGRARSLVTDGRPGIHGNCTNPECTGGFAGRLVECSARGAAAHRPPARRDTGRAGARESPESPGVESQEGTREEARGRGRGPPANWNPGFEAEL
jgi:hypothetical protein